MATDTARRGKLPDSLVLITFLPFLPQCILGSTTLHFDYVWFSIMILLQREVSLMRGETTLTCRY